MKNYPYFQGHCIELLILTLINSLFLMDLVSLVNPACIKDTWYLHPANDCKQNFHAVSVHVLPSNSQGNYLIKRQPLSMYISDISAYTSDFPIAWLTWHKSTRILYYTFSLIIQRKMLLRLEKKKFYNRLRNVFLGIGKWMNIPFPVVFMVKVSCILKNLQCR